MSMASYPGDLDRVTRPAVKPVSGEPIVTSLDRMEAITEHGTKAGYDEGCRGSHCPGKERVGMSCAQASIRYAGDMSYRRRIDGGLSAEAIWVEDQLDGTVMPKASRADRRGESIFDGEQSTVEDSVEDDRLFEDVAPAVLVKVAQTHERSPRSPQRPSVAAPEVVVTAEPAEPAAPVRGPKWAVRRVWVAVDPKGVLHGPHESQEAAMAYVASRMPKPKAPSDRGDGRGVRIEWTAERDQLIRQRNGEGVSDKKIAAELGLRQNAVSRRRNALGLPVLFRSPNQGKRS